MSLHLFFTFCMSFATRFSFSFFSRDSSTAARMLLNALRSGCFIHAAMYLVSTCLLYLQQNGVSLLRQCTQDMQLKGDVVRAVALALLPCSAPHVETSKLRLLEHAHGKLLQPRVATPLLGLRARQSGSGATHRGK